MSWRGKRVVVTGGSAGFGAHLATAFAQAGSHVTIVGRDQARLDESVARLNSLTDGATADAIQADVTSSTDVERLMKAVEQGGGLDVLVNNVGRSDRGRLIDCPPEKLREMWEANTLSALLCTSAAVPMLRKTKGSIVTIGSLAAKSASKFLGAYAVSKFPLAAMSQQLRQELADDGIHVLLVCPGPIDRDDAGSRYDALAEELPEEARRPGAGVKLKRLDPQLLAARVLDAMTRRKPELVVPWKARVLFGISQWSPTLGDWIVRRMT